ncbi:hypothetical protein TBLA_0F03910 [Henningerozyma blattae CBS 6284]|uniref:Uncharacterized protein n=1 Tax=Henningerozyma blattae (strain ATCC 34711 / CBS 6284 / DSM 70876 / NBRC 10599 / NRRL Y-10934 / UCD 77-7) TaxID=1071380 RepID=I2H6C3_HENB6|nr:hypothetical protein TBLA_0F03910 [Tetrapisispora blattae CBS 6284]CCH61925.1 hypothetical protein TBLA_0F03910 [Tetrapisispora blattae CBS 6284]
MPSSSMSQPPAPAPASSSSASSGVSLAGRLRGRLLALSLPDVFVTSQSRDAAKDSSRDTSGPQSRVPRRASEPRRSKSKARRDQPSMSAFASASSVSVASGLVSSASKAAARDPPTPASTPRESPTPTPSPSRGRVVSLPPSSPPRDASLTSLPFPPFSSPGPFTPYYSGSGSGSGSGAGSGSASASASASAPTPTLHPTLPPTPSPQQCTLCDVDGAAVRLQCAHFCHLECLLGSFPRGPSAMALPSPLAIPRSFALPACLQCQLAHPDKVQRGRVFRTVPTCSSLLRQIEARAGVKLVEQSELDTQMQMEAEAQQLQPQEHSHGGSAPASPTEDPATLLAFAREEQLLNVYNSRPRDAAAAECSARTSRAHSHTHSRACNLEDSLAPRSRRGSAVRNDLLSQRLESARHKKKTWRWRHLIIQQRLARYFSLHLLPHRPLRAPLWLHSYCYCQICPLSMNNKPRQE